LWSSSAFSVAMAACFGETPQVPVGQVGRRPASPLQYLDTDGNTEPARSTAG
jgi:hypothetical protein